MQRGPAEPALGPGLLAPAGPLSRRGTPGRAALPGGLPGGVRPPSAGRAPGPAAALNLGRSWDGGGGRGTRAPSRCAHKGPSGTGGPGGRRPSPPHPSAAPVPSPSFSERSSPPVPGEPPGQCPGARPAAPSAEPLIPQAPVAPGGGQLVPAGRRRGGGREVPRARRAGAPPLRPGAWSAPPRP